MGVLHSRWSVRKLTSDCLALGVVARARPTGMLTRPKEIDPFQTVRMGPFPPVYPVPDFSLAPAYVLGTGPIRRSLRFFLPRLRLPRPHRRARTRGCSREPCRKARPWRAPRAAGGVG